MNQSRRCTTEPKAAWISQAEYSSRTNRSVERFDICMSFDLLFNDMLNNIFQAHPDGEQVTLACLEAIEETHLEQLSIEFGLSCRTVKQDLGILVPLVLIELVGADGLETYRHRESLKNSEPRSCLEELCSAELGIAVYAASIDTIRSDAALRSTAQASVIGAVAKHTGRSASEADANAGSSSLENVRCFMLRALGLDLDDWNLNAFLSDSPSHGRQ